ncbi:hypothetical protein NliqN6_4623 [Naganishia liquefaciens]|uniref:Serine/threonine-protein phosphatase 4 regulatory subunit 3-like central domain-containing protein n=1 Tax=Naganishia liquefaciens TaxID=104408 RepID=A0A8H3TWK2_9TREE|nr:hypothetical protein NliqN6_4623 [Naganishia liquefaciens]
MSSSNLLVKAGEDEPKEVADAVLTPPPEETSNDGASSEELKLDAPTVADSAAAATAANALHSTTEEEKREEMREELERQRREGTQEDQDQRHEDPDLVQEEMVPAFQEGKKRVKVYELRGQAWEDRGTGFVEGIYDEASDEALLVVTREETAATEQLAQDGQPQPVEEPVEPGGFFREGEDPFLLRSRVGKTEQYSRQQETLIVWTETNGLDVALSFQDPEGCNNIWDFIQEVQRHLQLIYDDQAPMSASSSSPMPPSPQLAHEQANQQEQETALKVSSRSIAGREKTVEFVITNDYVRQMIRVFEVAEDMESLDDLHSLCTMMSTILSLNDNGLYEYLLQEDVFLGMAGIMEYDPEYPTYKASYREFLSGGSRFKEVVPIEDENVRAKIHQTYRLLYLKDVILARVLDDPMFNILNSLLFFNQIDIITHIANNDRFLSELFSGFKESKLKIAEVSGKRAVTPEPGDVNEEENKRRKDVVALLHQLMLMGKQVQLQHRQQLYRTLVERGLLFVCEWALKQEDPTILNQIAEMLSIVIDHDVNVVRTHALREHAEKRKTIAEDMSSLMLSTTDLGLKSQMADAIRTLVDIGGEGSEIPNILRTQRDQATGDAFLGYFYEACIIDMYKPIVELPDFKAYKGKSQPQRDSYLSELLAFFVAQHGHRAQFFILSNPVSMRIASLLYMKQKPLRHASLRYLRACLKASNHFIHRHLIKYEMLLPMLELLEAELPRDNMLSSTCLDILEVIRKDNLKVVVNHLFEKYKPRLQVLAERPLLKPYILALATSALRTLLNRDTRLNSGSFSKRMDTTEDDYFNGDSDEELIGPTPPSATDPVTSPTGAQKRKRPIESDAIDTTQPAKLSRPAHGERPSTGGVLGLDYDDGSLRPSAPIQNESTNSVMRPTIDSAEASGSNTSASPGTRIKLKLNSPNSPWTPAGQDLDEITSRMTKKRKQEIEQDEDGFGSLLTNSRPATPKPSKTEQTQLLREKPSGGVVGLGLAMKDAGKKLKINLGFGRKSGAEADKKKGDQGNQTT